MELESMYEFQEKLTFDLSEYHKTTLQREQIFNALFIVYEKERNLEWLGDVWDLDVEYDNALVLLKGLDFEALKNIIETSELIPKKFLLIEKKVQIKHSGNIWVIHKNDADPFPSQPHAHELEQNVKMDLSNGKLYRKTTFLRQISKKKFLEIRLKFGRVYHGELPELRV